MLIKKIIVCLLIVLYTSACKKFIEVESPITDITGESAFETDATATAVITGIYARMNNNSFSTFRLINMSSMIAGLSADELTLWSATTNATRLAYYRNNLSAVSNTGSDIWRELYPYIYSCNSAIVGLENSTKLTPLVKKQLLGEAKFLRAFFYFYLTNLYGDVPLVTSIDFLQNSKLPRSSQTEVYKLIIADLKEAESYLSDTFLDKSLLSPSLERVRPIKGAAQTLLARAYLFTKDWVKAEEFATKVINNNALFDLVPLNDAFLKNNSEAIWQMQPVNAGTNTELARLFILPATGPNTGTFFVYMNDNLANSFEIADQRKVIWVNKVTVGTKTYYYSFKYKAKPFDVTNPSNSVTEYLTVFRLAELYLIRSEARAEQNNITGAQADLNVIRTRAVLPNTTANDKSSLLNAIMQERRVELFTEWGHRWFDLKRTATVNAIMAIATPLKGGTWETTDQLYPVPLTDIQKNSNLTQNPGY